MSCLIFRGTDRMVPYAENGRQRRDGVGAERHGWFKSCQSARCLAPLGPGGNANANAGPARDADEQTMDPVDREERAFGARHAFLTY